MSRVLPLLAVLFLARTSNAGTDFTVEAGLSHDSNVFLLGADKEDSLDGTGKYEDMVSFSDWIVEADAGVELSTKAVGRRTSLRLDADVSVYTRNTKRSFAALEATLEQKLWKDGKAFARGAVTPGRFRKNYASGRDGAGDKIYKAGIYNEAAASGGVTTELGKRVALTAEAGVAQQTWNTPFQNRNDHSFFAEVDGDVEVLKRVDVGLEYEYVRSVAPGDSDPDDPGQPVDRSYASHRIDPGVRVELVDGLHLSGGASYRLRDYLSTEAGDSYRGKTAMRIGFSAGLRYSRGDWKFGAGYERLVNSVNEGTGDELDYTRDLFGFEASYTF